MRIAIAEEASGSIRPTHLRHELVLMVLALLCVHAAFTSTIRGYVVPKLTPAYHWKYGLQRDSDSQAFQEEAVRIADAMRRVRRENLGNPAIEGFSHTRLIAVVYYLTGTDTAYVVYVLNGLVYVINGLLLAVFFHRCGLSPRPARLAALALSLSPLYLFSHSELLREPLAVLGFLLYLTGLLEIVTPRSSAWLPLRRLVMGVVAGAGGFVIMATLRSYLMMPLALSMIAMAVILAVWPLLTGGPRTEWRRLGTLCALIVGLLVFYVWPESERVSQYSDASLKVRTVPGAEDRALPKDIEPVGRPRSLAATEGWKLTFIEPGKRGEIERTDFLAPHWCTVDWNPSRWLPRSLDAKFEALSCAREDFLRFCDETILGRRADRSCDEGNLTSAGAVLRHLPQAVKFGLFVPFPRMWLDDFGSGGTGLRRVGYVIDGIVSYVLLTGLPGIVCFGRRRPDLIAVGASLVMLLTICALAIPTQFVLARIRLALYMPFLALGVIGWLWLLPSRWTYRVNVTA